jgi:ribosome modulation factor
MWAWSRTIFFMEGSAAAETGVPREGCPHPPASPEREAWLAGWYQGAATSEAARGDATPARQANPPEHQ